MLKHRTLSSRHVEAFRLVHSGLARVSWLMFASQRVRIHVVCLELGRERWYICFLLGVSPSRLGSSLPRLGNVAADRSAVDVMFTAAM